jgi:hypothetical protein
LIEGSDDGTVKIATEKEKSNYAAAGVGGALADVKNAVLTADDKAAISAGKDINIWLEVKDGSTVSATDKALTENAIPDNYNLAGYLDITLWKQITGSDAVRVTEVPNGKVKVALIVPEQFQKSGRTYQLVRIHDGVAAVLETELDTDTYKLTFETDKFSSYALIYTDAVADTSENGLSTDVKKNSNSSAKLTSTSPETGDDIDFMLILMLMGVSITGIMYAVKSRCTKG